MEKRRFLAASAGLISLGMVASADAALISRLGGLAYYDDVLDITWLADAGASGSLSQDDGKAWAANLDVNGVTGWRLPTMVDTGTAGCNRAFVGTDCGSNVQTATSELASLWYNTLGNAAWDNPDGSFNQDAFSSATNTGPFSNVSPSYYTFDVEYALDNTEVWGFNFTTGIQENVDKFNHFSPSFNPNHDASVRFNRRTYWAVYSGDVGEVPVPAAVWLFGSGLMGLIGVARRRNTTVTSHPILSA